MDGGSIPSAPANLVKIMMEKFMKPLYFFAAGLVLGFGVALILLKTIVLADVWYWISAVFALIAGGFFLALGFSSKRSDNMDNGNKIKENSQKQ